MNQIRVGQLGFSQSLISPLVDLELFAVEGKPDQEKLEEAFQFSILIAPWDFIERNSLERWVSQSADRLQWVFKFEESDSQSSVMTKMEDFWAFSFRPLLWGRENLEDVLLVALDRCRGQMQHNQLVETLRNQNQELAKKKKNFEEQLQNRKDSLEKSGEKLVQSQSLWELTQKGSFQIYSAQNLEDMEQRLLKLVQTTLPIETLRIFLSSSEGELRSAVSSKRKVFDYWKVFDEAQEIGALVVELKASEGVPRSKLRLRRLEREFFQRIAELVGLAVTRIRKMDELALLREQWKATFNAVPHPLMVINSHRMVMQGNLALEHRHLGKDDSLRRKDSKEGLVPCYKKMFHREEPCPNCVLGKSFQLELGKDVWEVSSQYISETKSYFQIYKNITEEQHLKEKIRATEREAELGAIGASVAHELNNPLAGILSYVQVLKMEVPEDHALYPDLLEMEQAVKRSQKVIENILLKSRHLT